MDSFVVVSSITVEQIDHIPKTIQFFPKGKLKLSTAFVWYILWNLFQSEGSNIHNKNVEGRQELSIRYPVSAATEGNTILRTEDSYRLSIQCLKLKQDMTTLCVRTKLDNFSGVAFSRIKFTL